MANGKEEGGEPPPSRVQIESLIEDAFDAVRERLEKTWSRLRGLLLGGGAVLWALVGVWASSSPTPDDVLRAVVVVALSAMIAELVMYRLVPIMLRTIPPTLKMEKKSVLRMGYDAARRVILLNVLYVAALVIVWPSVPLWIGAVLGLIFSYNIATSVAAVARPKEEVLQILRHQLALIRRRPILPALFLGVPPPVLLGLGAWPYLTDGPTILAVQLGLPLLAMLFVFLHSTYSLAVLQSLTETQHTLSDVRSSLLLGEISSQEAWTRLTQPEDSLTLVGEEEE